MRGAAERDRRQLEKIVAQAWWNESLNGAGSHLKRLSHYLEMLKPQKPQSPEEMLAAFREYQSRGAPIQIRQIKPGELSDG